MEYEWKIHTFEVKFWLTVNHHWHRSMMEIIN